MKQRGWSYVILGFSLLVAGCESTLDWTFDSLPKLTIIAHPSTGNWDSTRVYVYASLSPLDSSQFYTPAKLEVEVTELESELTFKLDSVRNGNKLYFEFPPNFLKEGFQYSIKAYAPGFEPVHSTTEIPKPSQITDLQITDIKIEPSHLNDFKNILHYKVTFNIEHQPTNRYYHLVFYNVYGDNPTRYLVDPELSDKIPFIRNYDYGVLIDRYDIPAGEPLEFSFVDWSIKNQDLQTVYVELRSITPDYYKYNSTLARQVIIRQDPFAEPIPIFNNIEGGFGNFSGFSPNVVYSDLPH
ncbi:MAG TPA: DUF4249 domain-containing protein [Saprospiraceae bacterium]|nr:DUF4249 domain-containing protein [Saprospiraceae bacterium]